MWLASSFVSLRLDSVSLYFRISFVFQTDSLYQFLFKACPPSGVRGLLTSLFFICPCGSHRLLFAFSSSACRATTSHLTIMLRPRTVINLVLLAFLVLLVFLHCGFLKNFLHRCPVIKPMYRTIFVKPRKLSLSKSTSVLLNFLYRKAKRGLPFKKSK